jgi:hypothetical protein
MTIWTPTTVGALELPHRLFHSVASKPLCRCRGCSFPCEATLSWRAIALRLIALIGEASTFSPQGLAGAAGRASISDASPENARSSRTTSVCRGLECR